MAKDIKTIADLVPDIANANKGTERGRYALETSLRKYGAGRSILLDKSGRIVAGNKTAEVAGEIGIDDVIVVQTDGRKLVAVQRTDLDLDSPEGRELAWADNRVGELSLAWDAEQLFADIQAGIDLSGMFYEDELAAILATVEELEEPRPDPGPQISRADELQEKWRVQLGDLWQLGEHRLICGDCTGAAVVERVMGGEKAQLAWFDPPFGIDLQPQRQKTQAIENDGNVAAKALWAKFLPLLADRMSPDTNVFLCQDWSEFDWTLPLVRRYFSIKSKVVWNKNVWGIGYYTRPKHEDILYCWKGHPPVIDEPVADVWDVARENAPDHAAEKPPELSAIAIDHFCKIGDVVADWFCGVGGSIVACEQLGRKCRAAEIHPPYCAVTLQRFYDMTGVEPVRIG